MSLDFTGGKVVLGFAGKAEAADWYVDNTATGTNNGNSWENAWQSFSSIEWIFMTPGDTLYISGGAISKTYNERLKIQNGGISNSMPITIRTGQEPGHDGVVIINPPEWDGISISNKNYIIVSGQVGTERRMRVTGASSSGISIMDNSSHIKLSYLESDNNGSGDPNSGIEIWTNMPSTGIEIDNCYIHDNYQDGIHWGESVRGSGYGNNSIHHNIITGTHDDGIEIGASSVDFYNNIQGSNIAPERGHPDGIQAYGWYYRIYNNYFHGFRDQAGNAVLYIEPGGGGEGFSPFGHVQIYNNHFYENKSGQWSNGAICMAISGNAFDIVNDIKIINNTIAGHSLALILAFTGENLGGSNVDTYYVENNIIINGAMGFDVGDMSDNHVTYSSRGGYGSVIFDYNSLYNTGYSGDDNDHGIFLNPNLDSYQKPLSNSTVIDVGYDWSELFTTDKEKVYRPQGSGWDIGAYEYVKSSVGTTPPASPSSLTVQ